MVLIKILKRKDASSVIIAIVISTLLFQFIQSITNHWAIKISNVNYGPTYFHWKESYLLPAVSLLLGLLALEVLCWLWVWGTAILKKK